MQIAEQMYNDFTDYGVCGYRILVDTPNQYAIERVRPWEMRIYYC